MINERRGSSHPPARLRKTQKPSSAFRHRKPLWLASACGRFGLYSLTSQNWSPNNTPDSFGCGWALADVQDTPAGDLFYRESCSDICGARTPTQMGYWADVDVVLRQCIRIMQMAGVYFSFGLIVKNTVLPCQQH